MISDQYKCIFVEVPKTGTTSIRSILGEPIKPHLNIYQIYQSTSDVTFSSYFKFGFVRNPWDRAVSLFERREGMQLRNKMTFAEFIDWMRFASSTCLHPVPHRYQLDWFVNANGDVIVDHIGRFENLESDWERIQAKLGISIVLPKLNHNPNRQRDYREYYTKELADKVKQRFAVDIEYFNYHFET